MPSAAPRYGIMPYLGVAAATLNPTSLGVLCPNPGPCPTPKVRMVPDVKLEEVQQKEEVDRLARIKSGMSDTDLEKVIKVLTLQPQNPKTPKPINTKVKR